MKKLSCCLPPIYCEGGDDCSFCRSWSLLTRRVSEDLAYASFKKLDEEVRGMAEVREFDTGATRSSDEGRYDPEGYMSPIVEERFSMYMQKHQYQADGTKRESDNWQKGMSLMSYMKGLKRHVLHMWTRHRGHKVVDPGAGANIQEDLCAIIFNAQGYLHTLLAEEECKRPSNYSESPDASCCRNIYFDANPTVPVRVIQEEPFDTDQTEPAEPDSLVESPYNAQWPKGSL